MYQRVIFHAIDGLHEGHKKFECQFRSQSSYEKFVAKYQNYPNYRIFEVDLWDESKKSFGLPIVSNNYAGFSKVVGELQAKTG